MWLTCSVMASRAPATRVSSTITMPSWGRGSPTRAPASPSGRLPEMTPISTPGSSGRGREPVAHRMPDEGGNAGNVLQPGRAARCGPGRAHEDAAAYARIRMAGERVGDDDAAQAVADEVDAVGLQVGKEARQGVRVGEEAVPHRRVGPRVREEAAAFEAATQEAEHEPVHPQAVYEHDGFGGRVHAGGL